MKKWEILKVCKNVIDVSEEIVKNLSVKEMMKENVMWNIDEERNYNEWKVRNVRHMSLKERNLKENVKSGPFEAFCAKKGLVREKGLWERKAEKEIEQKEILEERKTAKSKRK